MIAAAPVVYRVFKDQGDVIALFPDMPEYRGMVLSYQHVGQHGLADYRGVIAATRPATAAEIAPLARELAQIGYTLTERRRARVSA